jgi:hypothetical protein
MEFVNIEVKGPFFAFSANLWQVLNGKRYYSALKIFTFVPTK